MQFVKLGEFLAAARITGPTHNLLQIRFSNSSQESLICECLPATSGCRHAPLDEEAIIKSVIDGIAEANQQLGSTYTISHIRYVENDTKPETVYGFLVKSILEHLHSGGEFVIGSTGRS